MSFIIYYYIYSSLFFSFISLSIFLFFKERILTNIYISKGISIETSKKISQINQQSNGASMLLKSVIICFFPFTRIFYIIGLIYLFVSSPNDLKKYYDKKDKAEKIKDLNDIIKILDEYEKIKKE